MKPTFSIIVGINNFLCMVHNTRTFYLQMYKYEMNFNINAEQ